MCRCGETRWKGYWKIWLRKEIYWAISPITPSLYVYGIYGLTVRGTRQNMARQIFKYLLLQDLASFGLIPEHACTSSKFSFKEKSSRLPIGLKPSEVLFEEVIHRLQFFTFPSCANSQRSLHLTEFNPLKFTAFAQSCSAALRNPLIYHAW